MYCGVSQRKPNKQALENRPLLKGRFFYGVRGQECLSFIAPSPFGDWHLGQSVAKIPAMKWLSSFFALVLLSIGQTSPATAGDDSIVVIELFTSQGCPACPPADKVLTNLTNERNTITLSWAVDYWDYLGWKDVNARPEYTQRQEAYNKALQKKGVYTPQMIINGRKQVVGSRIWDIREAITHYRKEEVALTPVKMAYDDGQLNVKMRAKSGKTFSQPTSVYLVWHNLEQSFEVSMGDNQGKTLRYSNVVQGIRKIGELTNYGIDLDVDVSRLVERGIKGFTIVVQDAPGLPIFAAGTLTVGD